MNETLVPADPASNNSPPPQPSDRSGRIMGIKQYIVFWIILGLITASAGFFVAVSYIELNDILKGVQAKTSDEFLGRIDDATEVPVDTLVRAYLEYDVLTNRQNRSTSAIASRTWLRFMSSLFGAILIFVGSVFVLAKIETSSENNIQGTGSNGGLALTTSSPGLVLTVVGAILMIVPNITEQSIYTNDTSSYFIGALNFSGNNGGEVDVDAQRILEEALKDENSN